jgi:hypothetical protein
MRHPSCDPLGNTIPLKVSRLSELSPASAGTFPTRTRLLSRTKPCPFPFAWQASERVGELIDRATIPAEAGLDSLKRSTIRGAFPTGSDF